MTTEIQTTEFQPLESQLSTMPPINVQEPSEAFETTGTETYFQQQPRYVYYLPPVPLKVSQMSTSAVLVVIENAPGTFLTV